MAKGYDNVPANMQLLLDLQFREGVGAVTHDWAKPHHEPNTLIGAPAWIGLGNGLPCLDFDIGPPREYIITLAADSADLDFTTGDFSGAAWFYPQATGNRYIFCKGAITEGWNFYIVATTGQMRMTTKQLAASQYTDGTPLTLNAWQLVGFTRAGANVRVYTNGLDVTATAGVHINPDTAVANNFYIGCADLVGAGWLDGYLWRPRVWNLALPASEMLYIFETEKGLFGL